MKFYILSAIALLGMASLAQQAEAQSKFYVVKDGNVIFTYDGTPDYITFSESELPEQNTKKPAAGYKGTVADAVDLGLPSRTLWASHNIGASSASEAGSYFAWGEITEKETYDWETYKYMDHSVNAWNGCTKYTFADNQTEGVWYNASGEFIGDGKTELDDADDVAVQAWGNGWQMPTHAQQLELASNCYWVWTTTYGGETVSGYIVYKAKSDSDKGKKVYSGRTPSSDYDVATDAHIFLPAAGYRWVSSLYEAGSYGYFWSRSLYGSYSDGAWGCYFYSGDVSADYSGNRNNAFPVRAVRPVSE